MVNPDLVAGLFFGFIIGMLFMTAYWMFSLRKYKLIKKKEAGK